MLVEPAVAAAQWGVSAGASLGSTTNGGSSEGDIVLPEGTDPEERMTDAFVRAAVGTEYLLRGRRSVHQFTLNFATFVHFQQGQLLSFNSDLLWLGTIAPFRDTELGLTVSATQGRTGDLYLFNRAGDAAGDSVARPNSSVWFAGAHAGETFTWQLGPFWTVSQNLNGDVFLPVGDDTGAQPRTLGADAHLGLARRWTRDGFGLRGGVGHGRSTAVRSEGFELFPAREASYVDGLLLWDHTINDDWNTHLGVGGLLVQVPQIQDPFFDVSASVSVDFRTTTGGEASAYANRGVATNVFVGDVLLQTGGGLRFTQFFGRNEAWQAVGGLDYQTGKSVFVVNEKQGGLDVFSAVATLNYEYSRHILVELEANYTYQDAEPSRRGTTFLPAYTLHRAMLMMSLAYVFPQPEKLTGGGGGRRRPRVPGRGPGGGGEVRTGLEAVLDPAKGERAIDVGAPAQRVRRETTTDKRDSARGYEEPEPTAPPGSLPPR